MTIYYPVRFYLSGLSIFLHFSYKLLISQANSMKGPAYERKNIRSTRLDQSQLINVDEI